jgi:adenine-specific DNA-methyltransferase
MPDTQLGLLEGIDVYKPHGENPVFLSEQLITYLGNKRSLLKFIGQGLELTAKKLNKPKITAFDVFSGSGVVSRYLKQHSSKIISNDLEKYAFVMNQCYLSNQSEIDFALLDHWLDFIKKELTEEKLQAGFISKAYAPQDENNIQNGERCFYIPRNAKYIDTARQVLEQVPDNIRHFFMAPLLVSASVHANTSGVFKGFYKNSETGKGQFGGNNKDALQRIFGKVEIKKPIFSNFESEIILFNDDANAVADQAEEVDVAYLDPPYNQHPYGSNYFMLNLILNNTPPTQTSAISGIPKDWKRSAYNKKPQAAVAMQDLVEKIKAKYLLISFNSEGFITLAEMLSILQKVGKTQVLQAEYNAFRGSRNLPNRDLYVKEYLYLVEKF